MPRLTALALIVVLLVAVASPAHACGPACGVAIGLASFFTLTALLAPFTYPYPAYAYPAYGYPAYGYPYRYPAYGYSAYGNPAPVVYSSPAVYSQPAVHQTDPAVYRTPAPAQVVRVVQYPHGRYELRGDGVTTPYSWVWVFAAPESPLAAASPGPAH